MLKKLFASIDRFEKIANYPDVTTITNIVARILSSNSSNPLLSGARTKPEQVSVSTNIDNNSKVYFQIVFEKNFGTAQANKAQINQWLAPLVVKELSTMFRQYEFSVIIGVVPA